DELLEFERRALEALRQPMEDGQVVIARAAQSIAFPAKFALVAAMNPCPCCNLGHPTRVCTCSDGEIIRYQSRLSGALADRIDMPVTLAPVGSDELDGRPGGEASRVIRERVERSRAAQRQRFLGISSATCNAHAPPRTLATRGAISDGARRLLA